MRSITWRTASSPSHRRSDTLSIRYNGPYSYTGRGWQRGPDGRDVVIIVLWSNRSN
jgi:hypothetical protein